MLADEARDTHAAAGCRSRSASIVLGGDGGLRRLAAGAERRPTFVDGVKLRIMQPNLPQDEKFNYAAATTVMSALSGAVRPRDRSAESTGVRDVTHLIWPESAFPFFLHARSRRDGADRRAAAARHGADHRRARAPPTRRRRQARARLQFGLRDRPRRHDPVGLRQGASGAVRRISAVSGLRSKSSG